MKHNRLFRSLAFGLLAAASLVACKESEENYTPYINWEARNAAWYLQVTDSARTAIAQAKAQYGDQWEDHCQWRQLKSLLKQQNAGGLYTDSICVRILGRGTGYSPTFSDSVRLNFRGWLMPATYKRINAQGVQVDSLMQEVFTQTYYGSYNPETAVPSLMAVSATVPGFSTALQYMREGDDWLVYIPQQLGYGATAKDVIPAYSTLQFRLSLVAAYPTGSGVPKWY